MATNSFGQNVNVNMVQMLSAYSSLINDGKYYQPHIVKRIESANGEVVKENSPVLVRQTVTASTSKYLRKYLENTVELGTAHKAYIEGILLRERLVLHRKSQELTLSGLSHL